MIIDEIKASLAMENLHLEQQEEKLLNDYAQGLISFNDLQDQLKKLMQQDKAAWILHETSTDSIYCYPGTDVLRNKFNQRDEDQLEKIERVLSGARLIDLYKKPIKGNFDIDHLKKIHAYLFQDLYSWAGVFRTVDISKGVPFCHAAYIEKEITKLFNALKKDNYLKDLTNDLDNACYRAGFYLSEINAIHPFRDGNGRTQREFIREIMLSAGFIVDYSKCDPHLMFEASVASFGGDDALMTELFKQCTISTIDK